MSKLSFLDSPSNCRKLVLYGMLAGIAITILREVMGVLVAQRYGVVAYSGLVSTFNVVVLLATLAIAVGFLGLFRLEQHNIDRTCGVAYALGILASTRLGYSSSMVARLILGAIFLTGRLALALRFNPTLERTSHLTRTRSLLVFAYFLAILYHALYPMFWGSPILSLLSSFTALITLIADVLAYLALRDEFAHAAPSQPASAPSIGSAASSAGTTSASAPLGTATKNSLAKADSPSYVKTPAASPAPTSAANPTDTPRQLRALPDKTFEEVRDTNGFAVWVSMATDANAPILIQSSSSLQTCAQFGRPCLSDTAYSEDFTKIAHQVASWARIVAGLVPSTVPYDLVVDGALYEAWVLERFARLETYPSGQVRTVTWTYCLTHEGNLNMVMESSDAATCVYEVLPYYPAMTSDMAKSWFYCVSHGCVAALDLVSANRAERQTFSFEVDGETHKLDFPWDESVAPAAYAPTGGLTAHLNLLVGQDIL